MGTQTEHAAIAVRHGMQLVQAEVLFTIAHVMNLHGKGILCYHGDIPTEKTLVRLLKMKAEGFEMDPDRLDAHVVIMAAHGLVHTTEKANKIAAESKSECHNRIEDN